MDELRHYTAVIPAGTTPLVPAVFDFPMPARIARAVQIIVPPGPSGLVGFALTQARVRVIPYGSDPWVITDNERIEWPLTNYNDAGSWGLLGYNTGAQAHTVYVRFLLDVPGLHPATAAPAGLEQVMGMTDSGYDVGPALVGGE